MASKNENGEEIAQVPTLEADLAMVGGNPSEGDACCVIDLNNRGRQVLEGQNDSAEAVIWIPRRRSSQRRRRTTFKFTLWQVEEMEKMFKETQYPDALARKELAQALNIPEVKVKLNHILEELIYDYFPNTVVNHLTLCLLKKDGL